MSWFDDTGSSVAMLVYSLWALPLTLYKVCHQPHCAENSWSCAVSESQSLEKQRSTIYLPLLPSLKLTVHSQHQDYVTEEGRKGWYEMRNSMKDKSNFLSCPLETGGGRDSTSTTGHSNTIGTILLIPSTGPWISP